MANKKEKEKPASKKAGVDTDKMKAIKETMDKIDKDFGKGTAMLLSEKPKFDVEVISTGSMSLDLALGVNGIPKGRVIEIYGPESSGKTTLATHIMAEAQKAGGMCAIIDAEHAFDTDYAERLGINKEQLVISQPDYGEQALEVMDRFIESGGFSVVMVDSVAALVPKAELEGEMGDSKMGLHARLMSQALRKITASTAKTNTTVIFINQLRDKIGVMFGSPETTTGGNALKFYASIRMDIRRISILKDGDEAYGNRVKVKIVKNKVAPPFKSAEFDLIYGLGINTQGDILDLATGLEIAQKNGSWYSYSGDKLGQGRDAAVEVLRDNPELAEEIRQKIILKVAELAK
jgi:recombination protein RecA